MNSLCELALAFMRISLGAFGGGLTTLPLIHHELVTEGQWLTAEGFAELISVAQITPGPVALNAATFVGYRIAGLPGACLTTACVLITPLSILAIIAELLRPRDPRTRRRLNQVMTLLAPGVAAMLFLAFLKLAGPLGGKPLSLIIGALSWFILRIPFFRNHPPLVLLLGGLASLLIEWIRATENISQ